ncbi:MAG: OB-fold domain-containing protein [Acidimicrobiia bacterium]|nr:OB-fold domain-containing protein [Acidimicrobiia bacterium]
MVEQGDAVRYEPEPTPAGAPFWEATRERRLVLPWCRACELPFWYPREICPRCLGDDLEWRPASGEGTVYAVSEQHRPMQPGLADRAPYPVVLVDLAEGVRMLSSVPPGAGPVGIGQPVTVAWEPLTDGRHLPLFTPAGSRAEPA